jgi:hypothetical protein
MVETINQWLNTNQGSALWDLMTCSRGPDTPSEKPSMSPQQSGEAYAGRRARKRETVEVIRGLVWPGGVGARKRDDISYVELPPRNEWDHFDRHVARAAGAAVGLGLTIEVREKKRPANEKEIRLSPKVVGKATAGTAPGDYFVIEDDDEPEEEEFFDDETNDDE